MCMHAYTYTCRQMCAHVCTRRHRHTRVHTQAQARVCVYTCQAGHPKLCPLQARHLLPQWSYGFYLIHLQGKQGFQFFCKTEDMKRKWMEQFEMAM